MGVIIRRDKNIETINFDLLDLFEAPLPSLPSVWSGPHVALRLTEGFTTLRLLPMRDKTGARSAWPAYLHEFEDLLAQQEQGELERTMQQQNRTRVSPSVQEIARMEQVTYWPTRYLWALHPQLCEAVNAVTLAHALGLDAGWVTRKRGGYADTWRARHDQGCEIIAAGLIRDRVSVF
jgi:hypothetical protein